MDKTLIITSDGFPPYINSVAILMKDLFYFIPKSAYVVILSNPKIGDIRIDQDKRMSHDYVYVDTFVTGKFKLIKDLRLIFLFVIKVIGIFKKYNINNILVIPSDKLEIGAYILSRLFRKPLYVYLFDIYNTPNRLSGWYSVFVRYFEHILLESANTVFVMSESLMVYYKKKYNINAVYLPHPIIIDNYKQKSVRPSSDDEIQIVYTGMIYEAQLDSILNVVNAVNSMKDNKVKFYLYTPRTKNELVSMGIKGENIVIHDFVKPEIIPSILSEADVLILPMAFNSPYPDVIRTASPGKLPVYLASGVPILVHAPDYSYVSQYAKKEGWGLVMDKNDVEELKKALLLIRSDTALRSELVSKALRSVVKHDAFVVSKTIQKYLGIVS